MARALILLAYLMAGACSPSEEGEVRAPMAESARPELARLVITGAKPIASFDLGSPCKGDLIVEVGEQSQAAARSYLLTVSGVYGGEKRRIGAHTPYPTGSSGQIVIPHDVCAGARRIEVEAQPIHGRLARDFNLPVVIKTAGAKAGE